MDSSSKLRDFEIVIPEQSSEVSDLYQMVYINNNKIGLKFALNVMLKEPLIQLAIVEDSCHLDMSESLCPELCPSKITEDVDITFIDNTSEYHRVKSGISGLLGSSSKS